MKLQQVYKKAVWDFSKRLLKELNGSINSIILYGSVVRGQATKDSDIDVLVIGKNRGLKDKVSHIAYEFDYQNNFNTYIVAWYYTSREFSERVKRGEPFIINILKEGEALYDNGFFRRRKKFIPEPTPEVVQKYLEVSEERFEAGREALKEKDYHMAVHDAYKAGLFAAEGLMLSKGKIPRNRKEIVSSYKRMKELERLDRKADGLDLKKKDALRALGLAKRMLGLARNRRLTKAESF